MTAYVHDLWDDSCRTSTLYIQVVHRLTSLGAVITQAAQGTSQQGFEAEWQESSIFMFDGELVSRFELFDEEDLDAALARFDQLSRPHVAIGEHSKPNQRAIRGMLQCA